MKSPLLKFLAAVGLILAALIAYGFFLEWQVRYWDRKIDELCAAEGGKNVGVRVYERVMAPEHYLTTPNRDGTWPAYAGIKVPQLWSGQDVKPRPNEPIVSYSGEREVIRDGVPHVALYSEQIVRVSDGKVLGERFMYIRAGGGIPSLGYLNRHICSASEVRPFHMAVFINHPFNKN